MKRFLCYVLASILLYSCSSSQDVINGRRVQKRKYQKGVYITKKPKTVQSKTVENQSRELDYIKLKTFEISGIEELIVPVDVIPVQLVSKDKSAELEIEKAPCISEVNVVDLFILNIGIFALLGFFGALIFGILALTKKFKHQKGTGLAIASLVILGLTALLFVLVLVLFLSGGSTEAVLVALGSVLLLVMVILFFAT